MTLIKIGPSEYRGIEYPSHHHKAEGKPNFPFIKKAFRSYVPNGIGIAKIYFIEDSFRIFQLHNSMLYPTIVPLMCNIKRTNDNWREEIRLKVNAFKTPEELYEHNKTRDKSSLKSNI